MKEKENGKTEGLEESLKNSKHYSGAVRKVTTVRGQHRCDSHRIVTSGARAMVCLFLYFLYLVQNLALGIRKLTVK